MLRELVVEEGLSAFEEDRECRIYTIQEMADFVGVGFQDDAKDRENRP